MKRRYAFGAFALVFTAIAATTILRCDFPGAIVNPSFSFIPRERPRVFVSHHPIRVLPGQTVTIRLAPDLRPEDGAVGRAVARIGLAGSAARQEPACRDTGGGTFDCAFTLPDGDNDFIYDGFVVLANGTEVRSKSAYRFRADATVGLDDVLTLREPVPPLEPLAQEYRVGTVWVHDDGDAYAPEAFLADIETAVYTGILADPVYRWRDTQLAFYQYGSPGLTSSYFSGFDTRCGQNPWPGETRFRTTLNRMDVIGVLHRHPGTAGGVEGTVTSTTVFRDCAGPAVKNANLRTFSAAGGAALVAKHEYGHAAFGLGDEYAESEATRRVEAAARMPDSECCCMPDDGTRTGTGTIGGSGGVVVPGGATVGTGPGTGTGAGLEPRGLRIPQCVGEGRTGLGVPGLRTCSASSPIPVACGATPQAVCPPLIGDCVEARMWLGQLPSAGIASFLRPNSDVSQADCEAGRSAALVHPGVEDREQSVEAACRQLCGGSLAPCPCGQAEGWIVDKNPASTPVPSGASTDSMGTVLAERHGGTCAWCVDTSLCVRWERARGQAADLAWSYCEAPPPNAADRERGSVALLRAIGAYIREVTKGWLF